MRKIIITGIGILLCNVLFSQSTIEYLDKILENLDKIKMATYYNKFSASAPGDTLAFHSYENFINMFINPADTFLGASFSKYPINNTNQPEFCYDGKYGIKLNWKNKQARIDTITNDTRRIPMAPFFINVKSLLIYAQENIDSSVVKIEYYKDSSKISFFFKNRIVEFHGLSHISRKSQGKNSRYELLIDKNYLPYKFIRKMPHQTSWETCTKIEVFDDLAYEFNAIRQIPIDFTIKGFERKKAKTTNLIGKRAKNWNLKEIYGENLSLKDIKSKVILIQFAGIGCGPCHMSIPFLNQLVEDNREKDFELICIETWSKNIAGIERYKDKNKLNCRFLVSDDGIKEKYKIQGVPTFFILDEKRVIKKVIVGYQKGETDKEIISAINKLL